MSTAFPLFTHPPWKFTLAIPGAHRIVDGVRAAVLTSGGPADHWSRKWQGMFQRIPASLNVGRGSMCFSIESYGYKTPCWREVCYPG